jgi:serine/threonine protein phosphatase 1
MIVIGDVHGCFDTLLALIAKVRLKYPDDQICFVGDLIDRGPKSRQVVQHIIDNNFFCVKGNHEKMMIDAFTVGGAHSDDFIRNGGRDTLNSYMKEELEELESGEILTIKTLDKELINKHIEWMKQLPLWLEFPEIKNKEGRYLVISHSGVGKIWDWSKERKEAMSALVEDIVLWERDYFEDQKDIYNIFGHTPTKPNPRVKSFYANIDTGGCYTSEIKKAQGYGFLSAIHFPSMEIFQQENIDKKL